jgi:hypothetical protein
MNDLATPNSAVNNDIGINVYISTVDLEVAAPKRIPSYLNSYSAVVQAGEDMDSTGTGNEPGCGAPVSDATMGNAPKDAHDADVYFGEVITSMRQLLRRYNFDFSLTAVNTTATQPAIYTATLPDTPVPLGYNSSTLHATSGGKKFNYVTPSLARLLQNCFVASRGSQRVKYVVNGPTSSPLTMTVIRGATGGAISLPPNANSLNVTSNDAYARASFGARNSTAAGGVFTPATRQPVLEVELPYYKNVRFDEARLVDFAATDPSSPYKTFHTLELFLNAGVAITYVDRYTAVGEDYSLIWWQGCPPIVAMIAPA